VIAEGAEVSDEDEYFYADMPPL